VVPSTASYSLNR